MLANPGLQLAAVADHFHVTQPWLSTVINSDVWRERYAARRGLMDSRISESITSKLGNLAEKTLDHLDQAIDDEEVGVSTKLDIAKTALTALGFLGSTAQKGNNGQQTVQPAATVSVSISAVQEARSRMNSTSNDSIGITIEHS